MSEKEKSQSDLDHDHYRSSTNVARELEEVKKTRMYVERADGSNISGVIIPHHTQIGLSDPKFKSDLGVKGNINIKGNTVIEGDLEVRGQTTGIETGGSEASTKAVYRSYLSVTSTQKLLTWPGSSTTSLSSGSTGNPKAWLIAPFSGKITAVQMAFKANAGGYSGITKFVVDIFRNVDGSGSRAHTISTDIGAGGGTDEFALKVSNVDGASSNYYYRSQAITVTVSEGDLIQVQLQRVGGTNVDATVSIVLTESSTPIP